MSADHFSTFSELKQTHVAKLLDKKMLNEDDNINVILQQKKMKTEQEIKVGNKNPTPVLRIEHY